MGQLELCQVWETTVIQPPVRRAKPLKPIPAGRFAIVLFQYGSIPAGAQVSVLGPAETGSCRTALVNIEYRGKLAVVNRSGLRALRTSIG